MYNAGMNVDILGEISETVTKGPRDIDIVYTALDSIMGEALVRTVNTSENDGLTLRLSAYVNALRKMANGLEIKTQI